MRPASAFAVVPSPLAGRSTFDTPRPPALPTTERPRSSIRGGSSVVVSSSTPSLDAAQLASSLSTVLLTALLLRTLGLKTQSSRILKAAARMSGQLSIMGLFVLTPLFAFASSSPWKIMIWVSFVAIVASREAASRSKYAYRGQMGDFLLALLGGVGLTLLHLVTCVLHRPFSPTTMKFGAQTIIPIAGMLFGNALSATTLGMSVLLSNFLEGRERVELRLARGASVREAALPAVREAVEAALMPTVNAMAATGLIFMPGMMTGQILGGQSPGAAAAYQIMIYFAIAASSCSTAMLLSCILTARMFDLRRQALIPWRSIPALRKKSKNAGESQRGKGYDDSKPQSTLCFIDSKSSISKENSEPILRVQGLAVDSTKLHVPLLEVYAGDRIGIRGRSGIGKTQLLRALARLDPFSADIRNNIDHRNIMTLDGQSWEDISPARWRTQIIWVSQDRPSLSGTPMAFYEQLMKYQSRRHLKVDDQNNNHLTPMEIARDWNLPDKTWDQPWSDVSGGEAQRLSLAIALSLRPEGSVLLLDEPTASCDADTTKRVERALIESSATILLVSHSEEQIKRFCTSMIELSYE